MRTIFICSFLLFYTLCFGQHKHDSIQSKDTLITKEVPFNHLLFLFKDKDSTLSIYQTNNITRPNLDDNFLTTRSNGNSANSFFSLRFSLPFTSEDNILGRNQSMYFDMFRMKSLLLPQSPMTEIFYSAGSQNDNLFYITHAQKIKKHLYFGFKYNVLNSKGFYNSQITDHREFYMYLLYKNKNYRGFASYDFGHYRGQENGGFVSIKGFEQDSVSQSFVYSVHMNKASRNIRNIEYRIENSYRFTKDTLKKMYIGAFISNRYHIQKNRYVDYQPDSAYYSNFGFNITKDTIFDTTSMRTITNEAGLLLFKNNSSHFEIVTSLENQIQLIKYQKVDTAFNNTALNLYAKIGHFYQRGFGIQTSNKYYFNGYKFGDYDSKSMLIYTFQKNLNIGTLLLLKRVSQPLFINLYYSPFFNWKRNFEPTQSNEFNFFANYKNMKLSIGTNFVQNLVYFDGSFSPIQCNTTIQISTVELNKTFNFGKHVELENQILFQKANNVVAISIPLYTGFHSLAYKFNFKHGVMQNKVGVEVIYNSSYYANSYIPMLGEYYVQKNIKSGDYPMFNFVASTKYKNAQFFFKVQHLNAGLKGDNYLVIPNYPNAGRSFVFGLLWKFLN